MLNILPENIVIQRSVPIYVITQLGLRSHPTGSSTLEALTTLSFIRSDKPVFNTPAFRPCSPCYPTQAVAESIVSLIRNPYLTFPGGVHHFHRRLDPGWGSHMGDSQIAGVWTRSGRELHITGAQGSNIGPQSLGYSITRISCFDCCRQHHCCSLHQQTRWDPFPPPVAAGNGSVSVASDSGHNTTVVDYINKQGGTHSHLLLRLVEDLFLWLQTRDITLRARHIPGCLNVIADRLSRPNLIFRLWETLVVDKSTTRSPQHASSPVHGSSSGALGTGHRCFVTGLAGEVNVHVSTVSPAQQSHSEAQDHPDGRGDTHRPLVAVTTVVSTPAMIECGSPARILSVPQRPVVTTGLYLKQQVIPSARMEALMQHYQAAGFSREVSKFAAAPTCRRPSTNMTNRLYDDRWLCFTTWATGRGFDQTIKGYRSCLASVLSRTGRAAEV